MRKLADKIINEDLSVRAAEAAAGLLAPPKPKAAKPVAGKRQDHLAELGERLGDKLDTRVKIALGAAKGTITIDFASVADLRRIFEVLGVDSSVD
jgi:ParB family chromosome partitioning protein